VPATDGALRPRGSSQSFPPGLRTLSLASLMGPSRRHPERLGRLHRGLRLRLSSAQRRLLGRGAIQSPDHRGDLRDARLRGAIGARSPSGRRSPQRRRGHGTHRARRPVGMAGGNAAHLASRTSAPWRPAEPVPGSRLPLRGAPAASPSRTSRRTGTGSWSWQDQPISSGGSSSIAATVRSPRPARSSCAGRSSTRRDASSARRGATSSASSTIGRAPRHWSRPTDGSRLGGEVVQPVTGQSEKAARMRRRVGGQ